VKSPSYKVRTDDGNVYILRQQTWTPDGEWDLVSFRQTKEERWHIGKTHSKAPHPLVLQYETLPGGLFDCYFRDLLSLTR